MRLPVRNVTVSIVFYRPATRSPLPIRPIFRYCAVNATAKEPR
jgi:hypothetical protein